MLWLCIAATAGAIDFSVPYVRDGASESGTDALLGFGATVGQIEVRNDEGNGIDGFDGHRHQALTGGTALINTGSTTLIVNYGYQDVQDFSGQNNPADENFHGTFVAGIMANVPGLTVTVDGTSLPFSGVAPGASYYGAIFSGSDTKAGFLSLYSSLNYLVNTEHVQTINNSWGGTVTGSAQLNGNNDISLLMDEFVGYKGKTGGTTGTYSNKLMVIAAGNSGNDTGLLGVPADSYNGLTVGALTVSDTNATALGDPARSPIPQVADYSSYKPLADGRNGVDVVAPGTNIWSDLAIDVAKNDFGITTNADSVVAGAADGTSFATPHVTGVAALLYGAGTFPLTSGTTMKGTFLSQDHKLIKAIIINSADKIPGKDANGNAQATWQPGLVITGSAGVPTAIAPLNYAVGSGQVDAEKAYLEYSETGNNFWDVDTLTLSTTDKYYTFGQGKFIGLDSDQPYLLSLTATLTWDRHVDYTVDTDPNSDVAGTLDSAGLSDLDLVLQEEIAPGVWIDIFNSAGVIGNVDQIYMPSLSGTYNYRLDVRGVSFTDPTSGEEYALAVQFATIPEPGSVTLLVAGAMLCLRFSRRLRKA